MPGWYQPSRRDEEGVGGAKWLKSAGYSICENAQARWFPPSGGWMPYLPLLAGADRRRGRGRFGKLAQTSPKKVGGRGFT